MINVPTVFVLGAGASVPYGYPTGAGLSSKVLEDIICRQGPAWWTQGEGLAKAAKRFALALKRSKTTSVDAFLEHRSEFQKVGKLAMASALLSCERDERVFPAQEIPGDWLAYLLTHMRGPFDAFGGNRVSFITFNYDRVLEHVLFDIVQNRYGKSDDECADVLRKIPIVHVHGSLGPLPWQESDGQKYGVPPEPPDLILAADRIKIVSEGAEEDPEFEEARTLIREAKRIYFLGFGYNKDNVERLHLGECRKGTCIFGSALGLTPRERADAEYLLKAQNGPGEDLFLRVELRDHDCLQFLRNEPVRLD